MASSCLEENSRSRNKLWLYGQKYRKAAGWLPAKLMPMRLARPSKKIDSFTANSDYSAMDINHNTQPCQAEMRRVIVLPVWRAQLRPVVDSKT
jgi:hypothetical protein